MRSSSLFSVLPALFAFIALVLPDTVDAENKGGVEVETTRSVPCNRKSRNGDRLHVNYRGTLQKDGSVFDTSYGRQPFIFKLGAGQVIKGWEQGMLDMCIGEERKLTIPPELGYGSSDMGKIPPNSVLVFKTELLEIDGVDAEVHESASAAASSSMAALSSSFSKASTAFTATASPTATSNPQDTNVAVGSEKGPAHDGEKSPSECKLLGQFALLVQAALGGLALLSLVWKRWRERPRRPVKVWLFDVSKQVVGSFLLHFANILMSMLSSGEISTTTDTVGAFLQPEGKDTPNPCSFYLLNLAIDTTIGIPILVFLLRILHALFLYTALANPPESLKSGNYGHPPQSRWWLKQALIYFLGLFGMKSCVFVIFQLFPWLGWVGDWALRWTEGKEWVQITFVMLIFPLVMNAAQYWIIDSFIKDTSVGDYDSVAEDDEEEDENRGLMGANPRDSEDDVQEVSHGVVNDARIKEANPLPLPVEFESEDERPSTSDMTK